MNSGSRGDAQRAAHCAKIIGAVLTARSLVAPAIDPDALQRLRLQVAARIRDRAIAIGKSRRAQGRDVAQRHGLALKQRLILSGKCQQAGRVATEKVARQVRAALVRRSKPAPDSTEIMRFHVETAVPTEPSVLRQKIQEELGFASVADMTKAGVTVSTPLGTEASGEVFGVSFAVRSPAQMPSTSQITAFLRGATGARVTAVASPGFAKLRRLVKAYDAAKKTQGAAAPKQDECTCCYCCYA